MNAPITAHHSASLCRLTAVVPVEAVSRHARGDPVEVEEDEEEGADGHGEVEDAEMEDGSDADIEDEEDSSEQEESSGEPIAAGLPRPAPEQRHSWARGTVSSLHHHLPSPLINVYLLLTGVCVCVCACKPLQRMKRITG